jgi:hypothetical protein
MNTEGTFKVTKKEFSQFNELACEYKVLQDMQMVLLNAQVKVKERESVLWDSVVKRLELSPEVRWCYKSSTAGIQPV